jgi:hypothetical protein
VLRSERKRVVVLLCLLAVLAGLAWVLDRSDYTFRSFVMWVSLLGNALLVMLLVDARDRRS